MMMDVRSGKYRLCGNYLAEGREVEFSGEISVDERGIIRGQGEEEKGSFILRGFVIKWNDRLVVILIKTYIQEHLRWDRCDHSEFYYQLGRKDTIRQNLSGHWSGNWYHGVFLDAKAHIFDIMEGVYSIEEIERFLKEGGSRYPLNQMRDLIAGHIHRTTTKITVNIILSFIGRVESSMK